MIFKTHCEIARGRIDPAPMVDIMFLLLIFLVLNSPYVLQTGIGVNLPALPTPPSVSFQGLVVTVAQTNLVFLNNQSVRIEDLPRLLRAAVGKTRNAELVVKADARVPHGTIVQIMGMAFEAGVTTVNLATRPPVPLAESPR